MRRAAVVAGLAAVLLAAQLAHADDQAKSPPPSADQPRTPPASTDLIPVPPAVFSPFGPGYDPLKDPPVEPAEKGPGITAATLVASGPAEIEELTKAGAVAEATFAVVVDVTVAAGSTTAPLSPSSVTAKPEKGDAIPLAALCTPTNEVEESVWRPIDAGLAAWHIAAGGKNWYCGGRTARMLVRLRQGGARLINVSSSDRKAPLVLLFKSSAEVPREVVLPGVTVKLPDPGDSAAAH